MKSNEKMSVSVEIYGTKYRLLADSASSASYVTMVAAHVDEQMHKIAAHNPRLDISRLAVLSAINIADDLLKLKEQHERANAVSIEKKNQELGELQAKYEEALRELDAARTDYKSLEAKMLETEQRLEEVAAAAEQAADAAEKDSRDDSIYEEYEKLKQEYNKLQSEFNEWIELTEEDMK